MITTLEWSDILNYFKNNTLKYGQKLDLKSFDLIELEADDIIDYLEMNSVSTREEEKILFALNHVCDVCDDDMNTMKLPVLNLCDELKFEIVKNLYNNLTLEQLQEIEKGITIKVI